jgi:hypothetical protein
VSTDNRFAVSYLHKASRAVAIRRLQIGNQKSISDSVIHDSVIPFADSRLTISFAKSKKAQWNR